MVHVQEDKGSSPSAAIAETIFHVPFIWIKAWMKICWKLEPGTVACAEIPQLGGWILRNGWLIKTQLHCLKWNESLWADPEKALNNHFNKRNSISAPLNSQNSVSTPTYSQMPLTSTLSTTSTKAPVVASSSSSSSGGGGANSIVAVGTVSSTPYQAINLYEVNSQGVVHKWRHGECVL